MISLLQLAQTIEQGLTSQLNDSNISFKVWANAGEYSKSIRSGNSVQSYIQGTLRSTSSSNEANILSMGYNGLQLDLSVPLQAPKTLSTQTSDDLQKIVNSQYPFVTLILSAIDAYFSISTVFQLTDAGGTEYTISMQAGRAITGNVDIAAQFGNNLIVTVFIGVYFLQGGFSARNVVINIDGVRVPLSSVTISRAKQKSSDVYQGDSTIKNLSSATAVSIDFAFPANSDNTTAQAFSDILEGAPNVVHFVDVEFGSQYDGKYLMMFDNLQVAAQGVQFAGVTGSLIECVENPLLINVPDYMQIGAFSFTTYISDLSFQHFPSPEETIPYYISNYFSTLVTFNNASLRPSDFIYNQDTGLYDVYILSIGELSVTSTSAQSFRVVKEASGNVIE